MLKRAKDLKDFTLRATDGEIGHLKDFYFDDRHWVVRYLVVATGAWLATRRVLISPEVLGVPEWDGRAFPIALSKDEVRHSPGLDAAQPISRHAERPLRDYYGWPAYYEPLPATDVPPPAEATTEESADPHLFNTNTVTGYQVAALDGDIGHIADFLIDDATWEISYLIVDTRNWLPGRHVLLDPEWIEEVDWAGRRIKVDLPRETIHESPAYDPSQPASSEYAASLHAHYGRVKRLRQPRASHRA